MQRLRSLLDRIASLPGDGSDAGAMSGGRVYECSYCQCTTAVRKDRCPECQIGRLVADATHDVETGFRCSACDTIADYRHERCPECGSSRSDSVP